MLLSATCWTCPYLQMGHSKGWTSACTLQGSQCARKRHSITCIKSKPSQWCCQWMRNSRCTLPAVTRLTHLRQRNHHLSVTWKIGSISRCTYVRPLQRTSYTASGVLSTGGSGTIMQWSQTSMIHAISLLYLDRIPFCFEVKPAVNLITIIALSCHYLPDVKAILDLDSCWGRWLAP